MGFYDAYLNSLQSEMGALQGNANARQTRQNTVSSLLKLAKTLAATGQTGSNTYNLAMGTGQGIDAISKVVTPLSQVAGSVSPTVSAASTAVGPTVQAASQLASAASPAASAASSATGATTGAASGATTGLMSNSGIVGAAIGAGLSISSAKPGDTLFGLKRFLYKGNDYAQSPLSPLSLGPPILTQHAKKSWDSVFGNPEQQVKDQQRSKAIEALFKAGQHQRGLTNLLNRNQEAENEY